MKIRFLIILSVIVLIGCAGSGRSSKDRPDPVGFRDIRWGTEISQLRDMEQVEQEQSSVKDLTWYRRKGDTLTMGGAKLENIFYSSWMGEFEGVWIDFVGEENFDAIKKDLFSQYGKPPESGAGPGKIGRRDRREQNEGERPGGLFVYRSKSTEIWLSYSKERRKGTLTVNSVKIGEDRREYEQRKEKEERLKR
jgi:hypothetical protein